MSSDRPEQRTSKLLEWIRHGPAASKSPAGKIVGLWLYWRYWAGLVLFAAPLLAGWVALQHVSPSVAISITGVLGLHLGSTVRGLLNVE